jgi:hypothetical protein
MALGECGPKVNWVGKAGFDDGYEIVKGDVSKEE